MASGSGSGCRNFEDPHLRKDNIDQWIKDGVDLVSLIDQGDVGDVDDVKQYLACAGDPGCVNRANGAGQTPLMIACRNGQREIVNFLLEAGADPNLTCLNHGNSALHYACQGDKEVILLCRKQQRYIYPKELDRIIKIVELLVGYGATLLMNKDGLSPACVAALNSFKDVVAFFASSSVITMPLADKVKAYELLGVSQACFDIHHAIDACESFHIAASVHSADGGDTTSTHIDSNLDMWLCDMMKKKNLNRNDELKVKQKAFTIGIQCVPDQIKNKHKFWNATCSCTDPAFFDGRATEAGYDLLVTMIKKEMLEEYPLGTVMEMMKSALESKLHYSGSSGMKFVPKLLEAYAKGFKVDSRQLKRKRCDILTLLGGLLFNLAYYQSEGKYLEQSLPFVGSIIKCLKTCSEELSPVSDDCTLSITSVFFDYMANAMWDDMYCGQSKKARNRLKFTIFKLLSYNGFNPVSDASLLETLVRCIAVAHYRDFIIPLAHVLVCYGCLPEDVCIEQAEENYPIVIELMPLLSSPTAPISLEELATRTVLRNNIPFRERLPVVLREKIEGELYNPRDSELDSATESSTDSDDD